MKSMTTPWGFSEQVSSMSPDGLIISVQTLRHGGIGINKKLEMPEYLASVSIQDSEWRWFEEDCGWACVALAFPQYFKAHHLDLAKTIVLNVYPHVYEKHYGVKPDIAESRALRRMDLESRLENSFRPRTAFGDWAWDVPKGSVYVVGFKAVDGSSKGFLVPKDQYANPDTLVLDGFPSFEPNTELPYSKGRGLISNG